ncbi:MAG: hypothetical protein BMS9Abin33_1298 [Gammaproteobacteria bacterium]|nr:MAG: hypothetical protein BMS9Abin33_1298 [Gammaproteobacteria bacterium]
MVKHTTSASPKFINPHELWVNGNLKWILVLALAVFLLTLSPQTFSYLHGPALGTDDNSAENQELSQQSLTYHLHQQSLHEYENGNYPEALSIWRTLAALNHAGAQYYLANMYFNGYGVTNDASKALVWYQRAAERGHVQSQYNMGVAYAKGIGINSDISQAIYWWRQAALSGNADAQFNLGLVYSKGYGINKDLAVAARWWKKAALQGDAAAQFNLGTLYANGEGVGQNLEQAIKLWQQAALQGFPHAVNALKSLSLYDLLGTKPQ